MFGIFMMVAFAVLMISVVADVKKEGIEINE